MNLTQVFSTKNLQLNRNDTVSMLSREDLLTQTHDVHKELKVLANDILESKAFADKMNDALMLAIFDDQKVLSLIVDFPTIMEWLDDYLHISHRKEELVLNKKFQYANVAFQRSFLFTMIDALRIKLLRKGFKVVINEQVAKHGINEFPKFVVDVQL